MDPELQSQIDYYDARADTYDDFWLRRGGYRLDEPLATQWRQDADDTMQFVRGHARGNVLELAAGTGIFTEQLAGSAETVHAVDASPNMLEVNRRRLAISAPVTYEIGDLFAWKPRGTYDIVFFGFWLSHVPDGKFEAFWSLLSDCLAPTGRVVFVDSRPHPNAGDTVSTRTETRTVDGRDYQVVKRYWTAPTLTERLAGLGWAAHVDSSANDLMLRGEAEPPSNGYK